MDWTDAAEEIDGDFDGRLVLTCEHASAALPEPWTWPEEDRWLVDTHWASDIGAAAFTRRLAATADAPSQASAAWSVQYMTKRWESFTSLPGIGSDSSEE